MVPQRRPDSLGSQNPCSEIALNDKDCTCSLPSHHEVRMARIRDHLARGHECRGLLGTYPITKICIENDILLGILVGDDDYYVIEIEYFTQMMPLYVIKGNDEIRN